jgi:sulfur carrier protein
MKFKVNGEFQTAEQASPTLADILVRNQVERPEMVSVQLNGRFVDSKLYSTTHLQENDEVDFLYFLGGGSEQ